MIFLQIMTICLSFAFGTHAASAEDVFELKSGYNTVIDEQNNILLETGIEVKAGDLFITEDNRMFEIISMEGTLARSRFKYAENAALDAPAFPVAAAKINGATDNTPTLIGIYHTHTDESYIPTDGAASTPGKGSILAVGSSLAERLQSLGYQTEHDQTLHDPHDANAYQRSRRTFTKLLAHQPAALFDIHRDSAPEKMYSVNIEGNPAAKILLVVGRQNPNRDSALDYAKTIKSAADAKYSGLIRGIFIAHGNYNQDLFPRSMLLEVGTQFNPLSVAERSVVLFADVVPTVLGPYAQIPSTAKTAEQPSLPETPLGTSASPAPALAVNAANPYVKDLFWLTSALAIGIAAYLFLSTSSWKEAKGKLKQFAQTEFANFLGPRRRRK